MRFHQGIKILSDQHLVGSFYAALRVTLAVFISEIIIVSFGLYSERGQLSRDLIKINLLGMLYY